MRTLRILTLLIISSYTFGQVNRMSERDFGLNVNSEILDTLDNNTHLSQHKHFSNLHVSQTSDLANRTHYANNQIRGKGKYNIYKATFVYGCTGIMPHSSVLKLYRRIGQWEFYHKNGNIKAKGQFANYDHYPKKDNMLNMGKVAVETKQWTYYYENGQKMAEGKYGQYLKKMCFIGKIDPIKVGKWIYFDKKGQVITAKKQIEVINELITSICADIKTTAKKDKVISVGFPGAYVPTHRVLNDTDLPLFLRD